MIDIKHIDGHVLYTAESASDVRAAVVEAVNKNSDLRYADLRYADLRSAKNAEFAIAQTIITPDGDLIGWKKCRHNRIVQLRIPADAARSNASSRKCRAAAAEVLAIFDDAGNPVDTAESRHDERFVYRVGETVTPDEPFDPDRWNECASGLHFYLTRVEAEAHV